VLTLLLPNSCSCLLPYIPYHGKACPNRTLIVFPFHPLPSSLTSSSLAPRASKHVDVTLPAHLPSCVLCWLPSLKLILAALTAAQHAILHLPGLCTLNPGGVPGHRRH
jgi:hypothetical protein